MTRATPRIAAQILRRMARALEREIVAAERDSLRVGLILAKSWSSGPFKKRMLAKLGHPYRHGGSPPADPALINRQSGLFLRSWRTEPPQTVGGMFVSRIVNDAPEATWLNLGTRRMIRRPIKEKILALLARPRLQRLQIAIKRALTPRL